MAKKKNKTINTGSQSVNRPPLQMQQSHKINQQKERHDLGDGFIKRYSSLLFPAGIAVITWLFLQVCINNQMTNWDDPGYIKNNPLLKDISPEGLKNIFSTSVMGNYHPLTILSYAIEYSYAGLQPMLYHIDSLLLHILVTVLVYWFVNLLTRRPVAAAVAALLFGLHPMHVESIAWLSGRKDVVYGVFYMAACIAYIYYVRAAGATRWRWYAATIVLFVCSLSGKPVAVILPVTLLLIDYFEKRKWDYWLLAEKIPHFAISIAFGIKSVLDQKNIGALHTQEVSYSFIERIGLGGYAFITYLWKAIVPARLICFYPYPVNEDGKLSSACYIYPLIAVAIIFVILKFARKNRVVIFGSLFFLANIALLLQFIPVGSAIIADRYAYIPYLGLFFIAGWLVSGFFEPGSNKQTGKIILAVTIVYSLVLGYLSNERCKAWYDGVSLWRNEIEKEPLFSDAYFFLGFEYFTKYNESVNSVEKKFYYDSAFYLFNKSISLQSSFANPYYYLGVMLRTEGKFPDAKLYFYKAISLKVGDLEANAYLGLANIYAITRNFDSSGFCYRRALELKPYYAEAHSNFGNFYDIIGKPDSALAQYALAIFQDPNRYHTYVNRGKLLQRLNRCEEAMKDFDKAIQLRPASAEVYYARSHCYDQKGNKTLALRDVEKAISLGFKQVDNNYYQALKR